ncbi:short-chain dehydrogenase, putative [Trypanosoma brucei gambiense DAL972]|uniref:3-dehydrosphinganine reductase n=2 Tax=Trypanosoma brucei TaxID=5691 RepID=D0A2C4_TRYB9|nr:short-chain dehydrogenase, putative [Trypanosoma brucei gambiense DAL972]RHW69331.1 3-keto-dihydrosphingosine reductase [Trypanosoma brucei equiperdum]CBH15418.1 short-chain dehydrogenase, putative [Trypanosoma brucei gambiense DAL972]|eukprot:XP_011777682.1 short-chain dehydrogenase, putative [Trypanosoma brucei gambiense DAL972]
MGVIFLVCALLIALVFAAAWWSVHRVPFFHIKGCCALVTGGSLGIGLETAKQLVKLGARVVIIAARNEQSLRAGVEALRVEAKVTGTKVEYVVMDVADEVSVEQAMDKVSKDVTAAGGKYLDLLVCNAGFSIPARFVDITPAEARRMMDVNFFGCVNVLRMVLPSMLEQRAGRVVFVSSLAARCPLAGYSVYAASKAAIRAFAHSMDMENSCRGVRFQVISPPDVYTPGFEQENIRKSPECTALSSFGGDEPVTALDMAKQIVDSIKHYRFDVSLGVDKQLLCWMVAGVEPATDVLELLLQVLLNGWLRLAMAVLSKLHYNIVWRVRKDDEKPNETSTNESERGKKVM